MSTLSWALTDDLPAPLVLVVLVAAMASAVVLMVELRQRQRGGMLIAITGVLSVLLLGTAVLRPVRVAVRGSVVGPRVVVLVDQSRRLLLPTRDGTRRELALQAVAQLRQRFSGARLSVLGFGSGEPVPLSEEQSGTGPTARLTTESDLVAAISDLRQTAGERPHALVVVSDGRLTRPAAGGDDESIRRAVGVAGVPVHTVDVGLSAPPDASIRSVRAAGAAVAHQPLAITLEIGCSGGLECGNLPVTIRELRRGLEPALLASSTAKLESGHAVIELPITLERAGARVVRIAIDAPDGDEVPENDTRTLAFTVARDRIRLLHVAGRPTYDVRALRMWLKADESLDLVTFFILRTELDDPMADESELALIPFPVDELFTQHLPSFDAVVLQDIDAVAYKLKAHLPALARYVEAGGGLIMVGGPSSFVGGRYADTALDRVLPVKLPEAAKPFDTAEFVPEYTEAGQVAPVLRMLRELFGDELPALPGANTLGEPREGAIVLLEHPRLRAGRTAMPVLALGEAGDGRAIALGVDATYRLAFGEFAARAAGRAYGAAWDGLLGWLMRDPRYEAVRLELDGECVAGLPTRLRLTRVPGIADEIELSWQRLGVSGQQPMRRQLKSVPVGAAYMDLGTLQPGGYAAWARVGAAPPARYDFACERGGEAWSDSRPDPERLVRIAEATGGSAVSAAAAARLPLPAPIRIAAERHVSPVLPPWVWTLGAALLLGLHWFARRRGGLV
jgi:uncharacterized membrane protein